MLQWVESARHWKQRFPRLNGSHYRQTARNCSNSNSTLLPRGLHNLPNKYILFSKWSKKQLRSSFLKDFSPEKKKRNESLDFLCVAIKWEDNSLWVHHMGLRFSIMDISGVTDKVQGDGAQQPTTWQELREQIGVHQPKAKVSTVTHSTLLHLPTPRGLMLDGLWWCVVVGCAHASVPVQEHRYPTETAVTSSAEFHSPPLKRWQCNTVCRSTECCCVICKHAAPPTPAPTTPHPLA